MTGQTVSINGKDGSFSGYLASPGSGRGPGLLVIQEIFGVNPVMRDIADGMASRGYYALVPDLFWRLEPGVQLTDQTDADWKKALDLMNRFDLDKGIEDIQAGIDHLRALPGCTGKVGALGYCLGGQLAYLAAARTDSDASVGYYGINIQNRLDEADKIKNPLMLHIAEKDQYVPPDAQARIEARLKDHPAVTLYRYPQMDHAFARVGGAHYDKANADFANIRSATFFRQNLS
ncbi:MAG: dienelactone hydrolase family protein [Alphaproteobacteria bacterium]|nr:dienelactone hydrolase family protein [Alphaproteobacteria bacterium]